MDRLSQIYSPLGIGSGSLVGGRYEIDLKLGAGATSAVYRARDKALNNSLCAIKIIDAKNLNSESDIERFKNEVVVTRKLTHPNIVRTFEYGQMDTGQFFITMEYVEGKSLDKLVTKEEGLISIAEVVFYLKAIAYGMQSAHDAKIIHRDLKPANVLVSKNGEIKITDFGLAKQRELDLKLTLDGECVGTPAYMSPEQLQGYKVDNRSDVYSFGILAYELLTGKLPFMGADWFSLGKSIVKDPLPEINGPKTRVPEWLCELIKKCTNKDPNDRPVDFKEVSQILEKAQLEQKDLLTRIFDTRINNSIVGFDLIKYAPWILAVSAALVGIIFLVEAGSKSTEKISQKVNSSQTKINNMIDNMNKAITVLQKLDQNSEVIDRNYEKVVNQESAAQNTDSNNIANLNLSKESPEQQKQNEKIEDSSRPSSEKRIDSSSTK